MKFPFFKSLVLVGALVVAWNCSDSPNFVNSLGGEPMAILDLGDQVIYINDANEVKDASGNIIGTYNPVTKEIMGTQGEVITTDVVKENLPMTQNNAGDGVAQGGEPQNGNANDGIANGGYNGNTSGNDSYVGYSGNTSGNNTYGGNNNTSGNNTSGSYNNTSGNNTSNNYNNNTSGGNTSGNQQSSQSSTSNADGTCYDKISGKNVKPWDENVADGGVKYAYKNDCSITCYYDPNNQDCASVKNATGGQQAGPGPQPKSSSSQQQWQPTSSNSVSGGGQQGSTPNFKIKQNGRQGKGWGSRYWDCCKPHCAWTGKGGKISRTCNAQQQTLAKGDDMLKSVCDGGTAGLCNDQRPIIVNDNLAYAFAAGPGNSYSSSCGTCLLLTFDGNSRHTTDARTKALKGKQLVIMISNIGYDVEEGQFDLMIPGGGVGAFNGCSTMWGINNLGAQHGGLLKDCGGDSETNDVAAMQKCLENKCNSIFANIPEAKAGCLFHAQWLMAANNPSFEYKELDECPSELSAKF